MGKRQPVYTRKSGKTMGKKAIDEHMKRIALPKRKGK